MTRWSPQQMQTLTAMGIEVWLSRSAPMDDELRIRLSSGHGAWLLVQRSPWRGQFEALLTDITHTLGVDQCRFGQWANSQESGIPLSALAEVGVARVISFGPLPKDKAADRVLQAPTMDALHTDPDARRAFWQQLQTWL